jgi:hypothetical protein
MRLFDNPRARGFGARVVAVHIFEKNGQRLRPEAEFRGDLLPVPRLAHLDHGPSGPHLPARWTTAIAIHLAETENALQPRDRRRQIAIHNVRQHIIGRRRSIRDGHGTKF